MNTHIMINHAFHVNSEVRIRLILIRLKKFCIRDTAIVIYAVQIFIVTHWLFFKVNVSILVIFDQFIPVLWRIISTYYSYSDILGERLTLQCQFDTCLWELACVRYFGSHAFAENSFCTSHPAPHIRLCLWINTMNAANERSERMQRGHTHRASCSSLFEQMETRLLNRRWSTYRAEHCNSAASQRGDGCGFPSGGLQCCNIEPKWEGGPVKKNPAQFSWTVSGRRNPHCTVMAIIL